MSFKSEWKPLAWMVAAFLLLYLMPMGDERFRGAILESFSLVQWYAREHVILCLVPAFFIAGGISIFLNHETVMQYLGPAAPRRIAYPVAAVSGTILAVCSCTVLPLFAGIYTMGAGLGPATAFLYSGPAINVLAIVLTARVLGPELGLARALGAIAFSVVIGMVMAWLFRHRQPSRTATEAVHNRTKRPLFHNIVFFALLVGILVSANWGRPMATSGIWYLIFKWKWTITSVLALLFGGVLVAWYRIRAWKPAATALIVGLTAWLIPQAPQWPFLAGVAGLALSAGTSGSEMADWLDSTWTFAKQILPLLFIGVFLAGLALGSPGKEGLIPSDWVTSMVGTNSIDANLFASVAGAFMYFATLTEVPILEGLMNNGMAKGPALALLLAGPALSLPNMLVIRSIVGNARTVAFVMLVILLSTAAGILFGWL